MKRLPIKRRKCAGAGIRHTGGGSSRGVKSTWGLFCNLAASDSISYSNSQPGEGGFISTACCIFFFFCLSSPFLSPVLGNVGLWRTEIAGCLGNITETGTFVKE